MCKSLVVNDSIPKSEPSGAMRWLYIILFKKSNYVTRNCRCSKLFPLEKVWNRTNQNKQTKQKQDILTKKNIEKVFFALFFRYKNLPCSSDCIYQKLSNCLVQKQKYHLPKKNKHEDLLAFSPDHRLLHDVVPSFFIGIVDIPVCRRFEGGQQFQSIANQDDRTIQQYYCND